MQKFLSDFTLCIKTHLRQLTTGHWLVLALGGLIVFVGVTGFWGMMITKSGPLQEDRLVVIPRGASVGQIAQVLNSEGVIDSPFMFKLSSKMMFSQKLMQAGGYKFTEAMPLRDVIKMLERGDVVKYKFTIPEGLTVAEVLAKLKDAPNLVGEVSVDIKEGSLLPETYQYTYGEKRVDVLQRMQSAMDKALNEAWNTRDEDLPLKNKEEMLVLASVVEKESSLIPEQPEVAGVFINRLRKKMRLQSDPTVIYGASDYNGNIRSKHLRERHPYNTYVIKGLPVGPIANPGKSALMAVAKPNETENLYFVADLETGGHIFAKTNRQHNINVQSYLREYKKRYGKK